MGFWIDCVGGRQCVHFWRVLNRSLFRTFCRLDYFRQKQTQICLHSDLEFQPLFPIFPLLSGRILAEKKESQILTSVTLWLSGWRISESNRWPFDCQDRISDFHHFISICISYHYRTSNLRFFTPFFPVFPFLWQIFWQNIRGGNLKN